MSWHYTVDDHAIVQHLPDYETAYHAGDGKDGPGNATSIAVEICVNAGGDFEAAKPTRPRWLGCSWRSTASTSTTWYSTTAGTAKTVPRPSGLPPAAGEAFLDLCERL